MGGVGLLSIAPLYTLMASEKTSSPGLNVPEKIVKASEGKKLSVLGDNQVIKLTGKDTDGRFTLIEQNNPPGFGIPMHVHEMEDEVFKVLEGKVEFTVGDKSTVLTDGDMIFLPRKIPHAFKVVSDTNAKVILNIFPSGLEYMFEELSTLPPGPPDFEKVAEICGNFGVKFV